MVLVVVVMGGGVGIVRLVSHSLTLSEMSVVSFYRFELFSGNIFADDSKNASVFESDEPYESISALTMCFCQSLWPWRTSV